MIYPTWVSWNQTPVTGIKNNYREMSNLRLFPNQLKVPCGMFSIGLHRTGGHGLKITLQ